MLLPPPGSSALKVLIEVPDYSRASRVIVRLTVLEAVSFKFGSDDYQACLDALQEVPAMQIPMEERTMFRRNFGRRTGSLRAAHGCGLSMMQTSTADISKIPSC